MSQIEFTVYGNPKAQKRHRTGKGFNYDPSEADKADFLAMSQEYKPESPFICAVKIDLQFVFPYNKTWRNSKGVIKDRYIGKRHIVRPDIDNLVKFVMDALAGVYWNNDTVICELKANKTYNLTPCVIVKIDTLDDIGN